jgi:hypothetical protein
MLAPSAFAEHLHAHATYAAQAAINCWTLAQHTLRVGPTRLPPLHLMLVWAMSSSTPSARST